MVLRCLCTAGDHRALRASDLAAWIEISQRMAAGQRVGVAVRHVKLRLQQAVPKALGSAGENTNCNN
jgi:hypothetical protein